MLRMFRSFLEKARQGARERNKRIMVEKLRGQNDTSWLRGKR